MSDEILKTEFAIGESRESATRVPTITAASWNVGRQTGPEIGHRINVGNSFIHVFYNHT